MKRLQYAFGAVLLAVVLLSVAGCRQQRPPEPSVQSSPLAGPNRTGTLASCKQLFSLTPTPTHISCHAVAVRIVHGQGFYRLTRQRPAAFLALAWPPPSRGLVYVLSRVTPTDVRIRAINHDGSLSRNSGGSATLLVVQPQ